MGKALEERQAASFASASAAQSQLQLVLQELIDDEVIDFACVSLYNPAGGFGLLAVASSCDEDGHFPPVMTPQSAAVDQFSLYGQQSAFRVANSGWTIETIVRQGTAMSCICGPETPGSGRPCEAGWLYHMGMGSLIAYPVRLTQAPLSGVSACVLAAIREKYWAPLLLHKLRSATQDIIPLLSQCALAYAPTLAAQDLPVFEPVQTVAARTLLELITLDRRLAERIAPAAAKPAAGTAEQPGTAAKSAQAACTCSAEAGVANASQPASSRSSRTTNNSVAKVRSAPAPAGAIPSIPQATDDAQRVAWPASPVLRPSQDAHRPAAPQAQNQAKPQGGHTRHVPSGSGQDPYTAHSDILTRLHGSVAYQASNSVSVRASIDWLSTPENWVRDASSAHQWGLQDEWLMSARPSHEMGCGPQHGLGALLDSSNARSSFGSVFNSSSHNTHFIRANMAESQYFASLLGGDEHTRYSGTFAVPHHVARSGLSKSRLSGTHSSGGTAGNAAGVQLAATSALYSSPVVGMGSSTAGLPTLVEERH